MFSAQSYVCSAGCVDAVKQLVLRRFLLARESVESDAESRSEASVQPAIYQRIVARVRHSQPMKSEVHVWKKRPVGKFGFSFPDKLKT